MIAHPNGRPPDGLHGQGDEAGDGVGQGEVEHQVVHVGPGSAKYVLYRIQFNWRRRDVVVEYLFLMELVQYNRYYYTIDTSNSSVCILEGLKAYKYDIECWT